jgi:hypothetical protein
MQQQGLMSNVACAYTDTSPIAFNESAPLDQLDYHGICGDGQTSMSNSESAVLEATWNGLASMVCKSVTAQSSDAEGPIYYIYLRGSRD